MPDRSVLQVWCAGTMLPARPSSIPVPGSGQRGEHNCHCMCQHSWSGIPVKWLVWQPERLLMTLVSVDRKPIYRGWVFFLIFLRFCCYCHQLGQGNFAITHGVTSLITVTLVSYCHLQFICLLTLPVNKSHLLEHFNGVRELLNETASWTLSHPAYHCIWQWKQYPREQDELHFRSFFRTLTDAMCWCSWYVFLWRKESNFITTEKSNETEMLRLQLLLSESTQRCVRTETM